MIVKQGDNGSVFVQAPPVQGVRPPLRAGEKSSGTGGRLIPAGGKAPQWPPGRDAQQCPASVLPGFAFAENNVDHRRTIVILPGRDGRLRADPIALCAALEQIPFAPEYANE
jgi:hypothetical protein